MTTTKRALALSFLERYSVVGIAALSSIVLSRLLTPHDIGLYSVGGAVTALLASFRDFGVATYLLQEPDLTRAKFHTALSISILSACIIAGIVLLAAPFAAAAYGTQAVAHVMHVTAASFLFTAFNSVAVTWFRREMRFGILFRMTVVGALCQTSTAIVLAALGFGFMALAWSMLANVAGICAVSAWYWPRQFGFRPSLAYWRPISAFGFYSMGSNLLAECVDGADDLIIGRIIGFAPLGQFSRANGLMNLGREAAVTATLPVAMSVFAVSARAGESFRSAYVASVELLTGAVWPVFAFLGLMAFPIIRILFGPQWDRAAGPAHVLALGACVAALSALHNPAFQASGALRQRMRVQLICTPVQILGMAIGAWFGLEAAAGAFAFGAVLEFAIAQRAINRLIRSDFVELARAVRKSACVAAATAAGPALVLLIVPPTAGFLWPPLLVAAACAGIAGPLALFALRHPLARELRGVAASAKRLAMRWL